MAEVRRPRLRVCMIRHGESHNNVLGADFLEKRVADPELTELGQQQAAAMGSFVASAPPLIAPIDELYVSPMRRTLMTMVPLAEATGLSPTVWGDIYEYGGCHLKGQGEPGLSPAQISQDFPNYTAEPGSHGLREDGWYGTELSKESVEQCVCRAGIVANRLREIAAGLEEDRTIAMVMHFDFIDVLLRQCLSADGVPMFGTQRPGSVFHSYNCSMSVLDLSGDGSVNMLFTNRHDYMPGSLVKREALGMR